jgi:transglutaminase-like putative cysteine protease
MLALITMKYLLLFLLLISLQACQVVQEVVDKAANTTTTISDTVTYKITQNITLINEGPSSPEKHNLWVALISDQPPYQEVISREIQPANYVIGTDEYSNQYAEFDLKEMELGSSTEIVISYEVAINEITYDLMDCKGDLPNEFIDPELHIESNNTQIVSLAEELSSVNQTVCEQIRAFYDYIGNNLIYTYNGDNWGAQAALGKMGADCTEFSSLLTALSRASGIPARYVEGLLYFDESDDIEARQEHAWVELYFPENGWTPVDPTLGRSTLTREQHFARYTPNHIIVTKGRNPSTLRGASYWSHLYWPGDSTTIRVQNADWTIVPQTVTNNR